MIAAGGAACVLVLVLVGLWASGVFKVKTKDGILVVEVNEPNPEVFVDGEQVTVTWDNDGKKAQIGVKPGTRKVEVKKDGFVVYGEDVEIADGGRKVLAAKLEPPKKRPPADKGEENIPAEKAKDSLDQWFVVGTRWEGKQVITEPNPSEGTVWFIVNSREGNRFRGRAVNEGRYDTTFEGVLNDDRSSFTLNFVDQAVSEWVPDRGPVESIEAFGKWQDGRVRIEWEWPRPNVKVLRGFWEFTARKVIAKPGAGDKWPPSLDPGKASCGPIGAWRVEGGELVQKDTVDDANSPASLRFGDLAWVEYDVRMKAMKTAGDGGFRIVFDRLRSSKGTQWCIGVTQSFVETWEVLPNGGHFTPRTEIIPVAIRNNQWYEILIKARGKQIECFLDGRRHFQLTDADRRGGLIGFTCVRMAARFKDIEIKAANGTVLWKGPPKLP